MPRLLRSLSWASLVAILLVGQATSGVFGRAAERAELAAQTATAPVVPIEFDVVSIKPNSSENGTMRIVFNPGMFSASKVTLKLLIQMAYGVRQDLIFGGQGWVSSSCFDIEGKISNADVDSMKVMTAAQNS